MDGTLTQLPMLQGYDHTAIAAAAVTELLGGECVVDMLARRAEGHSLRQIAERYGTSHVNVAKRLVATNWLRTIAWSLRALLALCMANAFHMPK